MECECRKDKETGAKLVCRSCEADNERVERTRGYCVSCAYLDWLPDAEHCGYCLAVFTVRRGNINTDAS